MFTRSFSFSLETAWPLWPNKWKDTWHMTLKIFTMSSDFVSWPPEFACHLLFVIDSGMVVACTGTISCAFTGVRNENGWQPLVYFKIHNSCLMCFSRPVRSGQTPGYLWLIYLHMYIIEYIYIHKHACTRSYLRMYLHTLNMLKWWNVLWEACLMNVLFPESFDREWKGYTADCVACMLGSWNTTLGCATKHYPWASAKLRVAASRWCLSIFHSFSVWTTWTLGKMGF